MRTPHRRRMLVAGIGVALLGACSSSPDPVLYTLAVRPGPVQGGGPKIVLLRDIGLAHYLDRPQIVRASDGYLLDVSKGDWWGEPLGRMIGRVLVAELSQRLPGSTVLAESGAISTDADATVEVNVQSFAANATGELVLEAQAAVLRPKGKTSETTGLQHIVVRPTSATTRGQVEAMSIALGQFADTLATLVRQ